MSTDPLDRLERLYRAARLHPPEDRSAFIEAACADDPDLQRELHDLLQCDQLAEAESFLDSPEWAPPRLSHPERLGGGGQFEQRKIGPYVLLRQLGHGGMGDVYLAVREDPFKQYVALKIVRRGMDSRDVVARFEVERQILAALNHPSIARLFDGGVTDDGTPYFAMEYVDGRPITSFCDEHRLNIRERLRLFRTVCEAVHYAHQNLIIHRDLKPSNILVTEGGGVKLLDFGIAKLLNPSFSPVAMPVTRTVQRLMTPQYASPEQLRGETLTTAADIYSLGVILYELLTGRPPHLVAGRTEQEIIQLVCDRQPELPSVRVTKSDTRNDHSGTPNEITPNSVSTARALSVEQLRRQVQGDLDNITLKALRKEATRRYASAEQLGQDVDRYLSGQPVAARPNTIRYRVQKFAARHKVVVVAGVLAVTSLITGLGVALWQADAARQERERAEQALVQSEAVTAFLMRLFESSDPSATKGDEVTARELLRRGVKRATEIDTQPMVQARMLDVVGRVYQTLGQYDEAGQHIERGLALRRAHLGENHLLVAESMVHLGAVLTRRGRYGEAETMLRNALAVQQNLLKGPNLPTTETLIELGYLLPFRGKLSESEAAYREVFTMQRDLLGDEAPEVANSLVRIAAVLRSQGRYDEAETAFRDALARHQRLHVEPHSDVAWSMFQLSALLEYKGDYGEAEKLMRRGLEIERKAEGEMHPSVSSFMFALGSLLAAKGDSAAADDMMRRALVLRRSVLGDHPSTADGILFLGSFLHEKGDLVGAESLYVDALSMRRFLLGHEHYEVAVVLSELARIHIESGRYDSAERMLRQALRIHTTANGPDHHRVGATLTELAQLHRHMGHFEIADSLYQEGLAILRKNQSEEHVEVQQAYEQIVDFYESWGHPERAAPFRALLINRSSPPP
jgi:serine/threonine-protein kinase